MPDAAAQVEKLLRQQAAIAGFGSFALRKDDLFSILMEAARVCAAGLDAPFCKVCRYRETENDLIIVAGYGWGAGVIDHVVARADASSPQVRAFVTGMPSICFDVRLDASYSLPPFYAEHGIVSTIDVVIKGATRPYGILEVDDSKQHDYDESDINFLTGFANVLAEAVATSSRIAVLQTTVDQMKALVEEKDWLLNQRTVLAEELQHRVRNNLQLVYGLLSKQVEDTANDDGKRGIRAIARRVSTLSQVYDHLLGSEMRRTTNFGSYVQSLCRSLADFQAMPDGAISLVCHSDSIVLDLDVVTALGIVVAKLVTNSYDHAYPDGRGSTKVSVRRGAGAADMATMTISDDGIGFKALDGSKRHGLGLVRRLVEQVRGVITVDSENGTLWTINFPVPVEAELALSR